MRKSLISDLAVESGLVGADRDLVGLVNLKGVGAVEEGQFRALLNHTILILQREDVRPASLELLGGTTVCQKENRSKECFWQGMQNVLHK